MTFSTKKKNSHKSKSMSRTRKNQSRKRNMRGGANTAAMKSGMKSMNTTAPKPGKLKIPSIFNGQPKTQNYVPNRPSGVVGKVNPGMFSSASVSSPGLRNFRSLPRPSIVRPSASSVVSPSAPSVSSVPRKRGGLKQVNTTQPTTQPTKRKGIVWANTEGKKLEEFAPKTELNNNNYKGYLESFNAEVSNA